MVAHLDDPEGEAGRASARAFLAHLYAGRTVTDLDLLDAGVTPTRAAEAAAYGSGLVLLPLTTRRPPLWFRRDVPPPPGWVTPADAEAHERAGRVWTPGTPVPVAPHVPEHFTAVVDPDGVQDTAARDRKRARRHGQVYTLPEVGHLVDTPAARAAFHAEVAQRRGWWCPDPGCDGSPHPGWDYRHARADQHPPSLDEVGWEVWASVSGRGSGKTAGAAAWMVGMSAYTERLVMIAPTWPDLRDVMVGGPSGLLRTAERWGWAASWEPSKHLVTMPNGAVIYGFTAEEPDRLRGTNAGAAWLDEPCFYSDPAEVWDAVQFVLRESRPRIAVSTTPKPSQWIRDLVADPATRLARVSTFANEANLAPEFVAKMRNRYSGTRIGRQELEGVILDDVEGALITPAEVEAGRVTAAPELVRVVVGVDPAGSTAARADSTGIVVLGRAEDGHLYVLADASGRLPPDGPAGWAARVFSMVDAHGAVLIVAERNYGGDMVASVLRAHERDTGRIPTTVSVTQSQKGKALRAEPLIGRFQQGRVHVVGHMRELETQLTEWVPGSGRSPDRLDALVHAFGALEDNGTSSLSIARGKVPRTDSQSPAGQLMRRIRADVNFRASVKMARGALGRVGVWTPPRRRGGTLADR